MADRYWVGGTASWDGTAGTKWATTSGGTGGASVPTTADDVFFTNLSTGTCTIGGGNAGAKSINCTGFTGTIAGTASITVAGSITLVTGMAWTHTSLVTITGTGTLTTAGKTFSGVTVNGAGITVTLGDALSTTSAQPVTVSQGTLNTANFSVTTRQLSSSNANVRTINLGSSTVSLVNAPVVLDFLDSTNLTFNAGTSQINVTGGALTFNGGSRTFFNVSFTTNSATGTRLVTGQNTFNNLLLNANATGVTNLAFSANQTINGTLTCTGSGVAGSRAFVRSDIIGTIRTITANAISANDCDFRDITLAGTAAGVTPTRAGDCGGNSGINFPAPKTVFRVGTSGAWAGANWSTSENGVGVGSNLPLPQDTAKITQFTGLTGTLNLATYNIGTLDASTRTTGIGIDFFSTPTFYGSFILGSGVTISGTGNQTFSGRGIQTFTSAGKTITFQITVEKAAGSFELGDATTTTNTITHTRGTFDAKNYNLTCLNFLSNNSNVRTITMGSGLWTITGTLWQIASSNLTFNKDTANILFSNTTTTARSFFGGGLSYNKFTIGGTTGTSTLSIFNINTFAELASTKTVAHTISFNTSQTIGTWSVTGTAGNIVTVNSSVIGTRRDLTLTNVTSGIDYLSITDIGELSGNKFYVGANSINGGNNLNIYFPSISSSSFLMLF